jgi:hypothetical protein
MPMNKIQFRLFVTSGAYDSVALYLNHDGLPDVANWPTEFAQLGTEAMSGAESKSPCKATL